MALLGHRLLHAKMLAAEASGENERERQLQEDCSRKSVEKDKSEEVEVSPPSPTSTSAPPATTVTTPPPASLSQNCLLSAPPVPAPLPLRRPFSNSGPRNE